MNDVIGSVQVVVSPDTTGFAAKARRDIERQFARKNALEVDFQADPDNLIRDLNESLDIAQKYLDLKKNSLKVKVGLDWRKSDLLGDLKRFKNDVQALEVLQRPTVKANFEVDRKGLEAIREDVKLNVSIDTKVLQRAINKGTEDITIFGDRKTIEKKSREAAEISHSAFQSFFDRRTLQLEIDADTEKLEQAQQAMENALGIAGRRKGQLADLEKSLAGVTKEIEKQTQLTHRLGLEWVELEESGEANAKQFSYYANELRDAEDSLREMVKQQKKLQHNRDHFSNNIVDPSIAGADRLRQEFDALERELDGKKVELGVVADRFSFALVTAELAHLARTRVARIVTAVSMSPSTKSAITSLQRLGATNWRKVGNVIGGFGARTTGVRLLWQTARDMLDIVPKLDMMIPQLAQTSVLASTIISGAGAVIGSAISIGMDMLKAAQAVLFAPAGLAGLALTLYSLNMAFANMDTLAPKAAKAMEEFDLAIAEGIWNSPGGKRLENFLEGVFNGLTKLSPQIGEAIGSALGALSDGIASVGAEGGLEFIENYIKGFESAEKGFKSFGSALARLAIVGSRSFEDLGKWFTGLMDDFDSWVQTNSANGNITKWINEAGQALRDIGSVIYSTGSIFRTFADIVQEAGGPSLSDFARGMRKLRDAVKGDWFKQISLGPLEAMFEFLDEFKRIKPETMAAIATAAGLLVYSLNGLKSSVVDTFGAIFRGFQSETFYEGWKGFIDGISNFLDDIGPGLERFVAELGGLFGVVGTGADAFGEAFNELLLLVSNVGANIHPGLESFLKFIGPQLEELIKAVGPGLEDIATGISDLLANEGFQLFLSDINDKLQIAIPFIEDMVNGILDLTNALFDKYNEAPGWLRDTISWLAVGAGAITLLALAIAPLIGPLGKLKTAFMLVTAPIRKFATFLGGLALKIPGVKGILDDLALRLMYGVDKIKAIPGAVMGILRTMAGRLKGLVPPLFRNLGSALLRGAMGGLKVLWVALPTNIRLRLLGMAIAIGGAFKGFSPMLARVIPKGGLARALTLALGRFAGVLAGPVGWALLIADVLGRVVTPINAASVADASLKALGLDDTFMGKFTSKVKENINETFGGATMISIVVNNFKTAFVKFSKGDLPGALIEVIKGLVSPFNFIEVVGDALLEACGISPEQIAAAKARIAAAWNENGLIGLFEEFWGGIMASLELGWDWLMSKFTSYKIPSPFDFVAWLWEKFLEWVGWDPSSGASGSGGSSSGPQSASYLGGSAMVSEFGGSFLDGVGNGFTELVAKILGWTPGGDGIDWWALLKKWLFGENPFGGVMSGVAGVIGGATTAVLDGIGKGVSTIKDGIEGLVMAPVTLGQKISDWALGKNPIDGVGESAETTITNESGALIGGIKTGIEALKEMVLAGVGGGEGVGGSVIDKALGVDELASARTRDRFQRTSEHFKQFGGTVLGTFGGIHEGGRREIEGLSDTTDTEFGAMQMGGTTKTSSMSGSVIGNLGSMASGAIGKITGMSSGSSSQFSSMKSSGTSKTAEMQSAVVARMGAMQSGATAKAAAMQGQVVAKMSVMQSQAVAQSARLQVGVVRAMSSANQQAVAQGRMMQVAYIGQMRTMLSGAMRVVSTMRSALPRGLNIPLAGAGRASGSSFVSGLAAGLARAVSTARSAVASIRSVLSFNASRSGAAIGSTFASGLRSRIGSVSAASKALAAAARTKLPNSPAKEGPFSGSGWGGWGESIADELARGMKLGAPAVAAEASRMMDSVASKLNASGQIGVSPDARSIRAALTASSDDSSSLDAGGNVINVNVESRSDEPFEQAVRFARDLEFALEGVRI